MKKIIFFLFLTIAFFGCQSKEEKAIKLIQSELSKTLYDYDSYSHIETTVVEAKQNVYNDTTLWKQANFIFYTFNKTLELQKEAEDAMEYMEIWGPPTYYSSSHSDKKYYKYKETYDKKKEEMLETYKICKEYAKIFNDSIKNIDENKIIGWEVVHKFRCKTKGGHSTIGNYRYIIDNKMENILIFEDMDDDDYNNIRDFIELTISGAFE